MTRNGDELVGLYNEIDDWLKKRGGAEGDDGFVARVDRVRDQALVRPHVNFLKDVARLRNAIVHDRGYPEIVADPRDELIARLRRVRDAILKPRLLRTFGSTPVALSADRPLREALALMRAKDFSQVVVELAEEFTLLSSEGILRWLEVCAENQGGLVAVHEGLLRQVVEHEPEGSCAWLAANQPVADAVRALCAGAAHRRGASGMRAGDRARKAQPAAAPADHALGSV